jgi:hypothetical protein
MQLNFVVESQRIARSDHERPHSGSIGYLSADFTFSTDWDGLVKTAIFVTAAGTPYAVQLDADDKCAVPSQAITSPHMLVSVRGDSVSGETVFVPTAGYRVDIIAAGVTEGETPEPPTPDVYAEMLNSMKEPYVGENGNWFVWDTDTRNFVDSGKPSKGNVMYATFDYDATTGEITMHTPDSYTGPTFYINADGEIVVGMEAA